MAKIYKGFPRTIIPAVFLVIVSVIPSYGADHRESPALSSEIIYGPAMDINDLYVFLNPNDGTRLVLIMTVNPFSAPSQAGTYGLSPKGFYEFHIDNNGDARAEHILLITSTSPRTKEHAANFEFITVADNSKRVCEKPISWPNVGSLG